MTWLGLICHIGSLDDNRFEQESQGLLDMPAEGSIYLHIQFQ